MSVDPEIITFVNKTKKKANSYAEITCNPASLLDPSKAGCDTSRIWLV